MAQRFIPFLILYFLGFNTCNAQDLSEKVISKLDYYKQFNPQEKVFLHLDKPFYMAGENIWFKGYLFEGINHAIDSLSAVLYVDLIYQNDGKLVSSQKFKCTGTTHGNVFLPDTLLEGKYTLRAYTSYMKNFSAEYFFNQEIMIWQGAEKDRSKNVDLNKVAQVADLQFFPEGGHLVGDLDSRVGFKAINYLGKGVELEGFLLENKKDTIVGFKSENLGMGKFNFKPAYGKTYEAHVKQFDGSTSVFAMPTIMEKGYVLMVDNLSSKDKIKIYAFNNDPQRPEKASELLIIAHQRGNLCFIGKSNNAKKVSNFVIPKNLIKDDGLVQITLMNAAGQIISERLIFNNANKKINLKLSTNKPNYGVREKVNLSIEATDEAGKPVAGSFSVAITDAGQVKEKNIYQENLLSYLLLSSDANAIDDPNKNAYLRGNIENPYYYFDPNNVNASYHLDLLMLSQGWRRFDWTEIMGDKNKKMDYFVETGLEVTGKATRINGKLADNLTMSLLLKNKEKPPVFSVSNTDSLGNFGFFGFEFYDSTTVLVQGSKENGSKMLKVTINPPAEQSKAPLFSTLNNNIEFGSQDYLTFLTNAKETLEFEKKLKLGTINNLDELVVKAKKIEEPDSRKLYGKAQNILKVDNIICASARDVIQMLQGRIAGVQVLPGGQDGSVISIRGGGEPLLLIDGIPSNLQTVNSLTPCEIEQIDVLKGPESAIYGLRGSNGAVNILTKRGNDNYDFSNDIAKGISVVKRIGYATPKEFYAPKYEVEAVEHVFPDFRSTLHWEPNLITDSSGKASFSFWNTDAKTNIKINAQGMGFAGLIGVGKLEYSVK